MSFAEELQREIVERGGISVEEYMGRCNAHYYGARDPFGAEGDFTTAPEISQMFGELIGAWAADLWQRAGAPSPFQLVELGPGRGTLMRDLLRAAGAATGFRQAAEVVFVETSPALRQRQRQAVPQALHTADFADVPAGAPLILIANELFDALPVVQCVHDRSRRVVAQGGKLRFEPAAEGVRETCPEGAQLAGDIAARLAESGGGALIVDYGYAGGETGDTLQAVKAHEQVHPLAFPGEADLTAHVDFAALREAAETGGARVHGPVTQAAFLNALGIGLRAEMLMKRVAAEERGKIAAAVRRLTAPDQMGALFKAMALTAPGWPQPAGFPA